MKVMASALLAEEIVIEASGRNSADWQDLWRYRGLLYFLTWRDVIVRYKQTVVGFAWAVLPAIMTTATFSIVFGRFAHLPSGGVPYPLFVLAGTLPWGLFANALGQSGNSLLANSHLISKVYFPRVLIPLSAMLVSLIDFLTSAVVLAVLMLFYRVMPSVHILALPIFLGVALAAALGVGLWLSALNVKYRDVRYVIPFMIQLGLYLSPVGFSSQLVPGRWRLLFGLNPMTGVIDGFRWAIFGSTPLDLSSLALSVGVSFALLVSGWQYFKRVEQEFADVI